jgi:hypothetical protein
MPRPARRPFLAVSCLAVALLALAPLPSTTAAADEAPAAVTARSRNVDQIDDFLRILFLPPGVKPTTLGSASARWAFFGASDFFRPPLSLAETLTFPGLVSAPTQDLVVLRCVPPAQAAEPTLATWPNVFARIVADLGAQYACPAPAGAAENEVYCLARGFTDTPSTIVSRPVHGALGVGIAMLEDPARAEVLRRAYGIHPAFSGLGFSVRDSGDGAAMLGAEVLRRSVVPEYLLKNVTLAEAGCRCISVPPYPGREAAPLDPDQVARDGGLGRCVDVATLGTRLTRFVTDLYVGLLGRVPDGAEVQVWTDALRAHCHPGGLASAPRGFLGSTEFSVRALTLPQLVAALYGAFLERAPTGAEVEGWLVELRALRRRAASIVVRSAEFRALVPHPAATEAVRSLVARIYSQMLGRVPSAAEAEGLAIFIATTGDLEGAVGGVIVSSEFEARALSIVDFVTVLYRALLARDPDAGGLRAQRDLLTDGLVEAVTRVLIGSAELRQRLPELCGS